MSDLVRNPKDRLCCDESFKNHTLSCKWDKILSLGPKNRFKILIAEGDFY